MSENEKETVMPKIYIQRNVICILHFICASHRQHENERTF